MVQTGIRFSRRTIVVAMLWAFFPGIASAICAGTAEDGRWRNTDGKADRAFVDVKMVDCGDQVLNGQQTTTRYSMKVWVRQSSGKFHGRPAVNAIYRQWDGKRWLYGKVPTGGYLDHMWVRAVDRDGQRHLHVRIKHESLDSKPSASSEFWFRR